MVAVVMVNWSEAFDAAILLMPNIGMYASVMKRLTWLADAETKDS
jgi:hypothetical protein